MRYLETLRLSIVLKAIIALLLLLFSQAAVPHETTEKLAEPGFRPDSEHAQAFIESLGTATIAVYPTIIRREKRTANSYQSRDQIVALLNESGTLKAVSGAKRVDLGKISGSSQWDLFQTDMQRIAGSAKGWRKDARYHLFMEFAFPVSDSEVFGIQCYILDSNGNNAFSFLLNSHHRSFVDARLIAKNSSEEARTHLLQKATALGVSALQAQIEQLRERAAAAPPLAARKIDAGIFDDFESGLPSGADKFGIPIGFVTFTDGHSALRIAETTTYPTLPDRTGDNAVLKLDFNVSSWAAFAHIFENDSVDTWVSYDWSPFDEFSFWLYGNKDGTSLFVDILDNRKPWSTVDDAERFVHYLTDNFSGWKKVTVRFADMHRKPTGNSPPNDGMGLSAVHGWALGVASTGGPTTYYVDDFELRTVPGAGGTFFQETRIDESSSIISFIEGDTGDGNAAEKSLVLMCECAKLAQFKGSRYFRTEDPREPGDERMRVKISFYKRAPPGLPVLVPGKDVSMPDRPGSFVIDAEDTLRHCNLLKSNPPLMSALNQPGSTTAGLVGGPTTKKKLCSDAVKAEYPINELAMYGHRKKTPAQLRADEQYIAAMTVAGASRAEAAERAAKLGWNTYYAGDCAKAMRRFNQAWLLDPENQLALWGFAVIALERDNIDDAIQYFEAALKSGPPHLALQQDYQYVSQRR